MLVGSPENGCELAIKDLSDIHEYQIEESLDQASV